LGRLFWKFFFFIWLAQLTTVMGVSATFWFKNHELNTRTTNIDESNSAGTLVESASSTLHYAGVEALRNLLGTRLHSIIYAVDENNKDILGRPVPPAVLEQARQALTGSPELNAVKQVKTGDGHVYLLFSTAFKSRHELQPPRAGASQNIAAPRGPGHPHGHHPHFPIQPNIAGLFASLVFAALLAWYFSKPIHSLRSAFESAAEGNLEVRVGDIMGKRRDDLADLGHDFDRMARQLRALMDGQRRLLHDVSHELRSPLARLQAAIGLARQQPDKLESSLDRIEREGMRMDKLVGELLTLSRLEAGVLTSTDEEIDIDALVDNIVKDARFEAETRGITVNRSGNFAATIRGNMELLHWTIENVVRNAVKHTPNGAQVSVDGRLDGKKGYLILSVLDDGPGVPESELNAIFEPFFRGRKSKGNDGHGLGLSIARRIVEKYDGTIRASNRPTRGLRIEIMLPAHAAAALA
jgi:two-component system OmpR family sensor kinase